MRKVACLFLFFFSSLSLFSQKTIDTHWGNGVLKTRVKMNGLDTTYVEFYQENGNLCYQRWGKDSFYILKNKKIASKTFFNKRKKMRYSLYGIDTDSFVSYDDRGATRHIRFLKEDKTEISQNYRKGILLYNEVRHWLTPSIQRIENKFVDGRKRFSSIRDTLIGSSIDSVYYLNGKLKYVVKHTKESYSDKVWGYDTLGNQIFMYKKDTNNLIIEKDNAACLYGFKNKKDEWVIKPTYENIVEFDKSPHYKVTYSDGKYNILDKKGLPLFSNNMELIEELPISPPNFNYVINNTSRNIDEYYYYPSERIYTENEQNQRIETNLLKSSRDDKYGVINWKGDTILDFKYDDIQGYYNGLFEVQIGEKWGVVNEKGDIIVKPQYYSVDFTHTPQYFIVVDTFSVQNKTNREFYSHGIIDNKGNFVLPINYYSIVVTDTFKNKFMVTTQGEILKTGYDYNQSFGIFNADKRVWELDTIYKENEEINVYPYKKNRILEKKDPINKKTIGYGIVDDSYSTVLPFENDYIKFYSEENKDYSYDYDTDNNFTNVFAITKKNEKYGLFNVKTKHWVLDNVYDKIEEINVLHKDYGGLNIFINEKNIEDEIHKELSILGSDIKFLSVKKDNKWQLVYGKNEILIKESFDYISKQKINLDFKCNHLRLIKNNKSEMLTAESYPLFSSYDKIERSNSALSIYAITDLKGKKLILNKKNEVIVPPQYKTVFIAQNYILAVDTLLKKQKIINFDGSSKEFLTQFTVLETHIDKGYSIVENPKTKLLGLVNNDGKSIIPCAYFSIATSKENDIIFVKKQAPNVSTDSVIIIHENHKSAFDSEWQMFDSKGKQLSKSYFDYPFLFYKGVGTSKVNDKYGIWQVDGKILLPPQYEKIIMDTSQQIFYLFKRWSDSSLAIGFADMKGRIIQEPKLDKMSRFFGDYAVGFTGGKHIVINKKGEYVVPPFANSLLNYKGSIYDSLWKVNLPLIEAYNLKKKGDDEQEMIRITGNIYYDMDLKYIPPFKDDLAEKIDSLATDKKAQLLNFIIEKTAIAQYMNTSVNRYQRHNGKTHISSSFKNKIFDRVFLTDQLYEYAYLYRSYNGLYSQEERMVQQFDICKRYMSIATYGEMDTIKTNLLNDEEKRASPIKKLTFYNVLKGENGIENIELEDILNINKNNALKLNELLIQKVKALKNEKIDCSNPSIFFEETKRLFFAKDEGLIFYLSRNLKEGWYYGEHWNNVPLLLTWEELKPFLKKKP
jgi:WG containing repeat